MRARAVGYAAEAEDDLGSIYRWLNESAGPSVARRYVDRVMDFCEHLDIASERGTLRPDLFPGLRTLGFERRLTIAFVVEGDEVRILRIFRSGQDWEATFD